MTPHLRSFFLQQVETITKIHNWTQCGNQQITGNPVLTDMPSAYMAQETEQKRGWKKCKHQNTRKSSVKHLFL